MSVMHHLAEGEDILARIPPFYATTRRLLRHERAADGKETVQDMPYYRVRSIEAVRPPNHRMMIGGTVVTLSALFLSLVIGFVTPLFAVPVGIAFVVMGGSGKGKEAYYQLHGADTKSEELARWRIPHRGSMEFMAVLTTRTGQKPKE